MSEMVSVPKAFFDGLLDQMEKMEARINALEVVNKDLQDNLADALAHMLDERVNELRCEMPQHMGRSISLPY